MAFYDRIKTAAATGSGTGNFTWTTASTGYALPPVSINELVVYTIVDAADSTWETGRAVLSESGGTYTLARGGSQVVTASSNSGSAVTFTTDTEHSLILTPDADFLSNMPIRLSTVEASSDATIELDLPTGYDRHTIVLTGILPASDNVNLVAQFSSDGGSTWITTGYDYAASFSFPNDTADIQGASSAASMLLAAGGGNATGEVVNGEVDIYQAEAAALTSIRASFVYNHFTVGASRAVSSGGLPTATSVDAIRFSFSSGNIASGRFSVYGGVV